MTTITPEQRQAIEQSGDDPVHLIDPETNTAYVLMKADTYQRLQSPALDDDDFEPQKAYPFIDEVMREDDENDPSLERYQHPGRPTS